MVFLDVPFSAPLANFEGFLLLYKQKNDPLVRFLDEIPGLVLAL